MILISCPFYHLTPHRQFYHFLRIHSISPLLFGGYQLSEILISRSSHRISCCALLLPDIPMCFLKSHTWSYPDLHMQDFFSHLRQIICFVSPWLNIISNIYDLIQNGHICLTCCMTGNGAYDLLGLHSVFILRQPGAIFGMKYWKGFSVLHQSQESYD